MAYFTTDLMQFLKDLAANNNKVWYDANKKRFENSVKKPFEAFVAEMINRIQQDDKSINIQPKDAIFRIYRDVRFSKDKTPYKTYVSAIISAGGRKNLALPGTYIELNPEHIRIYGGVYQPDKIQLQRIRESIIANPDKFNSLVSDKQFVKCFVELRGEKNKVLPKELKPAAEKQPLIFNKQFYYFGSLDPKLATDNRLPELLMEYYFAGKPMKGFLSKALK